MDLLIVLLLLAACSAFAIWHAAIVAFIVAAAIALVNLGIIQYAITHPWQTLLYAAGYFIIGAVWSVAKWWFTEKDRRREAETKFRRERLGKPGLQWVEFAALNKTVVVYHKSDILEWIAFWPISLVYTFFNDPVRRLCRRIYTELQGVYQRITDHIWE